MAKLKHAKRMIVFLIIVIPLVVVIAYISSLIFLDRAGIGFTLSNLQFHSIQVGDTLPGTKLKLVKDTCPNPNVQCTYLQNTDTTEVQVGKEGVRDIDYIIYGNNFAITEIQNKQYLVSEFFNGHDPLGTKQTDEYWYRIFELSPEKNSITYVKLTATNRREPTGGSDYISGNRILANSEGFIMDGLVLNGIFNYIFRGIIPANAKVI